MLFSDFQVYYDQYKHKIFSYLYYRSGRNKGLAEDLTADVFLKALQKFSTYNPEKSFQAWIFAIAHNHLVDHFRKNRTTVNLDDVENVVESSSDPKSSLSRRVATEEVEQLLQELSDEEKEILLMRYHQELSMKDIADTVERPEPTVRVIVHRAIEKMRKRYAVMNPV